MSKKGVLKYEVSSFILGHSSIFYNHLDQPAPSSYIVMNLFSEPLKQKSVNVLKTFKSLLCDIQSRKTKSLLFCTSKRDRIQLKNLHLSL